MSTSPAEGAWIELTCDGNRRALVERKRHEGGDAPSAEDLDADALYECYRMGGEATKKIIEVSRDRAVGLIAAWTWSTKNWKRPKHHADAVFRVTTEFLCDLEENWVDLPENSDVRLLHMGRRERLDDEAPAMMEVFDRVCAHTRERRGMVVALMMDYAGPDEEARARERWKAHNFRGDYESYLDLPMLGVPYRELDLRIRTGENTRLKHINGVMRAYAGMETREVFRTEHLPIYTPDLYAADLEELVQTEKRQGK